MILNAKQTGYILLPVIVAITLVAAIALMMNTESALESNIAASELDAHQAQYVAEAGLNHALWRAGRQGCGPYTDLVGVPFGAGEYNTQLTHDLGVTTSYSIPVDQDAWIGSFQSSNNHGSDLSLHVSQSGGDSERALLRYDLSALPVAASILSATAWFYVQAPHPEGPIEIHGLTTDWGEADATWDSMGAAMDATILAMIPPQPAAGVWVSVNLTSQVQSWVNSEANYGFALSADSEGVDGQYQALGATNPPYLEVIVGTPPTSPALLKAIGTLAGGNSRTLLRTDVGLHQQPGFAYWQSDAATGKDTYLYEWKPTWNYGVSNDIWVDDRTSDSTAHGLIRFDLGAIPAGARVTGAKLELYRVNPSLSGGPIGVYAIDAGWDEGTKSGGIGESSWNQRDASQAWASAGGDFGSRQYALESVPAGTGWSAWEIGGLVDDWVSGRIPNEGLALLPETAGSAAHFASSDNSDPTLRPKLSVAYACACGEVCVAPRGSGKLLMVVANSSALLSGETDRINLIESWGYTVSLIDDDASQSGFDSEIANNDVVYIPASINAAAVGDKLTWSSTGVVNEAGSLDAVMGYSSSQSIPAPVGHSVDIIDNSHYITQLFPAGALNIYSADMGGHAVAGLLAGGLQTLANWNAGPGLAVLEAGAVLGGDVEGENAAGRRVTLPFGQDNSFNWSKLNNNGRLLLQRAIAWGAGLGVGGCTATSPLLLVVGDAVTLSTKDAGMKNLMESWCYVVTVIDDGDNQANFDAAAAVADVVYVSGTTSGPALQDKLTGSPTPMVNEINGKLDNFGFSSSTASSVTASAFSATNSSHYISEPFAGNPVTFFTTDLAMPVPGGTLAPGLQTVGETTGVIAALVTLDSGAQRWDGNPAPARRVHLPFTNAEPSQLTADGETLMQRAIEWAGEANIDTGPLAHWKLDETSGPTAVDSEGGHDGTWTNDPAAIPGVLDGGLDFDGLDDYVNLTSDAELTDVFDGGATVTGWIYPRSWGESNNGRILDKANQVSGDRDGWMIALRGDTPALQFAQGFTGTRGFWRSQSGTVSLNNWTHFAIVYDGSSVTNDAEIYLNGVNQSPLVEITPTGTIATDAGISLRMGNYAQDTSRTFDGIIDDVRIYDRVLGATEINDLYVDGAPSPASYTELYQTWSATADDTWQTVTLGVPANAVVEVAVINGDIGKEYSGGVRAVGSGLERRFQLHEAESGGVDAVTMHVQTDASSQIQHYSDNASRVSFILLGYWTGATYMERFDTFKAGADASWQSHDLGTYGVGANQIAEIAASQTSTLIEWLVGARQPGSSLNRLLPLHEAEDGGVDMVAMMAGTNASSMVEVYAQADSVVDFHLLGYWSKPPGTYTETVALPGQASLSGTWHIGSLTSFGIPANAIAQFVLSNERDGSENLMGLRETGSTINTRMLDLQEAEDGGGDLGTMHVRVDGGSEIQWTAEYGASEGYFYLIGWWVLTP